MAVGFNSVLSGGVSVYWFVNPGVLYRWGYPDHYRPVGGGGGMAWGVGRGEWQSGCRRRRLFPYLEGGGSFRSW